MIDDAFDIGFFLLITYVFSKFIFIKYKIDFNRLIEKHPLGRKKIYAISEISFIEENGEFSKWPRLYAGMNWIRLSLKNGKDVNICWLEDHYAFLQKLKAKHSDISSEKDNCSDGV